MIATPTLRMGRLPDDQQPPCEAVASPSCPDYPHKGTYRIEVVKPTTGEVWRRHFCTSAAGGWCFKRGIEFDIGPWEQPT